MTAVESDKTNEGELYDKILEQCLCLQIKKSARTLTNLYDKALSGTGINSGQYSILLKIECLDSPTLNVLAEQLNLKSSSMSRALTPLEREDLIVMTRGKDKRTRRVKLTSKGKQTVLQAIPLWKKAQDKVTSLLGDETGKDLNTNLSLLSDISY